MEEGNPRSGRRIETRIVVKQDDHWVGYTYAWNEDQTDAQLVEGRRPGPQLRDQGCRRTGRETHTDMALSEPPGVHVLPLAAAGFVLGLRTHQMNRPHDYGAVTDNQLRTLEHIGFSRSRSTNPRPSTPLPRPLRRYGGPRRPRKTYLWVNCAMCHVGSGGGNSNLDLGLKTPLEKANLIDEPPLHGTMDVEDARLVVPGHPERSMLYTRVNTRGTNQMPPTSTNLVDDLGARLLFAWIERLEAKPETAAE